MKLVARFFSLAAVSAVALTAACRAQQQSDRAPAAASDAARTVAIHRLEGKLRVEIGGELLTEYRYEGLSRPILYPLVGPTGARVTRDWPIDEGDADEARDHPHHKSLWFAHGAVNGHDFWSESKRAGKIVHRGFDRVEVADGVGIVVARNDWIARDGQRMCSDVRTMRFFDRPEGVVFDHDVTLHASHGDVVLGDTKEGTMAIRLKPTLRLRGKVAEGHARSSTGVEGRRVWGKRAAWVDYWGPLAGETVGVAIFDHPGNFAHPTWWHARDYGLVAANPFGVHDFEGKPAGTGERRIASGKSLTLRYRFYVHEGDWQQARVAAMFDEYAGKKPRAVRGPERDK